MLTSSLRNSGSGLMPRPPPLLVRGGNIGEPQPHIWASVRLRLRWGVCCALKSEASRHIWMLSAVSSGWHSVSDCANANSHSLYWQGFGLMSLQVDEIGSLCMWCMAVWTCFYESVIGSLQFQGRNTQPWCWLIILLMKCIHYIKNTICTC